MKINCFRVFQTLAAAACVFAAVSPVQSLALPLPGGPSVSITSPANGAQFTASCSSALANITITAAASGGGVLTNCDEGACGGGPSVIKVEFYYNGTHLIGTDFTPEYSVVWTDVPVGTYTLTARAYFSNGAVLTSAGMVITVISPAITLDSNQSGYTFLSGTTYYIKNPITISGTTVLQAGTVLKYAPAATVTVDTLDCQTTSDSPAILTARDDDSVGCVLPESTHVPTNYYAGFDYTYMYSSKGALSVINYTDTLVKHVRILYANCAVYFLNFGPMNTLQDVWIINCHTGTFVDGGSVSPIALDHVTLTSVVTAFEGNSWTGSGNSVVVSGCYNLAHDYYPGPFPLTLNESLFLDVQNLSTNATITVGGNHNGFHNSPQFGTNPYSF
jgi:Bacterial Ig domain